ncbi:MAG: SDR family oxidoreductase [Planctomycetota bacterium]
MSADTTSIPMGSGRFDLSGRRALITGSTQGLGLTLARGLARAGASVVINGRTETKVGRVVDTFNVDQLAAAALVMDATDVQGVVEGVQRIENDGRGPIDILVNNVGIHQRAPLAEMSNAAWDTVISTNLTSAFTVSREVAKGMLERKAGKIINICSLMSDLGRPTTGNYAAAKGGLRMLTRAMAVEWAGANIQVNAIGPGYFATELTRELVSDEKFNAWICERTPANRWGNPDELIGAAVFFASSASSFINGQILYVDGGLTASI